MKTITITMTIPDACDDSEILDAAQDFAVTLAEEACDDVITGREAHKIRESVSVAPAESADASFVGMGSQLSIGDSDLPEVDLGGC